MFIVLLKFSDNRDNAGKYMNGHQAWLKEGFERGIFILSGSLQPKLGGGIIADKTSLSHLQQFVETDPFVSEGVVKAEIIELTAGRTIPELEFLLH